jgi:short-subunit dehydrogenase involved in D-alanine esterification of teichoic acids
MIFFFVCNECHSTGGKAHVITVDVRDPQSVEAMFKEIEKEFGRLDVLFNNAGVMPPLKPIEVVDELLFVYSLFFCLVLFGIFERPIVSFVRIMLTFFSRFCHTRICHLSSGRALLTPTLLGLSYAPNKRSV